jgi:hypothetical protein
MHRIYDDYKGVGINLREMSRTQKKNAESPVKVWDLINELTYFASHTSEMVDRGFGRVRSEANSLQKQAGRLFDKATLDRENVVASPYTA